MSRCVPTSLVLCLVGYELRVWQIRCDQKPKPLPIEDELSLIIRDSRALEAAWTDVQERLKGSDTPIDVVHWVADRDGRRLWHDSRVEDLAPVQMFAWEWLSARFGFTGHDPAVLEEVLMPWLTSVDDATERVRMQEVRMREHQTASDQLSAERARLQQENERLHRQNAALQQVDMERLITYLPALFPRVFTVLGAFDLALLCGRVEPPNIPNPYPEPSEEALRVLQRGFRALPRERQKQIVEFVAHLPQRQRLQPRPEMRDCLDALEGV